MPCVLSDCIKKITQRVNENSVYYAYQYLLKDIFVACAPCHPISAVLNVVHGDIQFYGFATCVIYISIVCISMR